MGRKHIAVTVLGETPPVVLAETAGLGLWVHPAIEGDGWSVTHRATGAKAPHRFRSRALAREWIRSAARVSTRKEWQDLGTFGKPDASATRKLGAKLREAGLLLGAWSY